MQLVLLIFLTFQITQSLAEPIVITGCSVPSLIGVPLSRIRISDAAGHQIPFQIDEITSNGEYVCDQGEAPNSKDGNGLLDAIDEITFLWEDADSSYKINPSKSSRFSKENEIVVCHGEQKRAVYLSDDLSISLSKVKYIEYNHQSQFLKTPWFYAQFGKDRFHFIKAGVKDFKNGLYRNLTNELRLQIRLEALWGMLPITYTEESVVCLVKRYKVGPIRLIRRGDFHLNLGLGVRGSKAAVNQICYPQIVKVPVYVHVPFRFKNLFSEAYLEMTPVVRPGFNEFSFKVPSLHCILPFSGNKNLDTLIYSNPNHQFMTVDNGQEGYGWMLNADIAAPLLKGSGYLFRKPSQRSGSLDCGYRLSVTDVPKGYYNIINWVLFSRNSMSALGLDYLYLNSPAVIQTKSGITYNALTAGPQPKLKNL